MGLWHEAARFPIKFPQIESLVAHDNTEPFLSSIDKLTPVIRDIFKEVQGIDDSSKSPSALQKEICEFLCLLEPRGFLICLGIRKTIGSQDTVLPPERAELESMYNRLNKVLTEEELLNSLNPS